MADVTASESTQDTTGDSAQSKSKGTGGKLAQSAKLAQKWQVELAASKKWMAKFHERARKCEKAYIDDGDSTGRTKSGNRSTVNLFWSNVQVILSAIYGRLPKAQVDRKFKDFDDDVSRVAALILQRILNGDLEDDADDTNPSMRDAVQDRFVSGLGQVWCRYDVETEQYDAPVTDPMTGQPEVDPATGQPTGRTQKAERILNEEACTDYVYWEDFRYAPCRRWRDCRWVARAVLMSRERLQARFNLSDEQLGMVPFSSRSPGGEAGESDVAKATPFSQARVWEIWDKDTNQVCWYCEGCSFVLDYQQDILQLDDFFPCPCPITATTLTKAFLPKPDYVMAQDLYEELDVINTRLAALEKAIKAVGVRDKNAKGVERMFTEAFDNDLVPIENWSAYVEKGGLKGCVDWMPIEQFVNAVTQLTARKQQVQHDLYELLGLSDIMRGASVASETATAQQLKVQYGGARLANLQGSVGRFVAEVMKIRANIIANHFQPETIKALSLIDKTADAQYADQAIALIKQFGIAQHAITVDADSLAAPDWDAEKQIRTEFMGATSNFIMAAGPLVQQAPQLGVFLLKLLQWGTAGFKGASTIEGVIDQAVQQVQQAAMQPPPPAPPSPEDQKHLAQADESKAKGAKAGAEAQRTQMENAVIANMVGGGGGIGPGGPQPGGPQPGGPQPGGPGFPLPGTPLPAQAMPPAPMQ